MADVGEIWHRARHDRAYREQLERDPASALAGAGLTDDELALLDVDGLLHLLGHDHAEEDEAAVMRERERFHLARCGS